MKVATVVYVHELSKSDWSSPKSYHVISLLDTLGKIAEKCVADHLSHQGEEAGWWHADKWCSREGRSTIDYLAYLMQAVDFNRSRNERTAVLMTDVSAAFPSTFRDRVLQILCDHKAHANIFWVASWLSDRPIDTWLDMSSPLAPTSTAGSHMVPRAFQCSSPGHWRRR